MASHEQVWVKVNTQVDTGLAEIIESMNRVDGLQTLQSCQGDKGHSPAYIYFSFGDWQQLCGFVFGRLAPQLRQRLGDEARITVEAIGDNDPIGKLSFSAEAISHVASALKEVGKRKKGSNR